MSDVAHQNGVSTRSDPSGRVRLSESDITLFAHHLEGLARSGLPLSSGLRALAAELPSGDLRRAFERLARSQEIGNSIAESVREIERAFPPHLVGIIAAGERSGGLADFLARWIAESSKRQDARNRFRRALFYPLLILGVIAPLLTIGLAWVCRSFESLERLAMDFGLSGRAPTATVGILRLARFVRETFWLVLAGISALSILGLTASFLMRGTRRLTAVLRAIPISGPVVRLLGLSEFCHTLGLLIDCGIGPEETLMLAGAATGDEGLIRQAEKSAELVRSGRSPARSIVAAGILPAGFGAMLSWGEAHGKLPEALAIAAGLFSERSRSQIVLAQTIAVALAWLAAITIITLIVMGVFFPLMQIFQLLSALTAHVPGSGDEARLFFA